MSSERYLSWEIVQKMLKGELEGIKGVEWSHSDLVYYLPQFSYPVCVEFCKRHSELGLNGGLFHYWLCWQAARIGNVELVERLIEVGGMRERADCWWLCDLSELGMRYGGIRSWFRIVSDRNESIGKALELIKQCYGGKEAVALTSSE